MSSPLNDPQMEQWFRRFDAASRRLPAEERASQREEIQQHLVGLVAAKVAQGQPDEEAWKAALTQFGDATQIGRKMYHEWQQGRTGFCADMRAILFGASLTAASWFLQRLLWSLWFDRLYHENDSLYTHGHGLVGLALVISRVVGYGGTAIVSTAVGRKYPFQAIKSAFYADVLWNLWFWWSLAVSVFGHTNLIDHAGWTLLAYNVLLMPFWMIGRVTAAYLASVTKRGWYKPSLADFKLTPPRKRLHLGR